MNQLPKYLIAYNNNELPGPVVISTQPPYLWAKIWQETDALKFLDWCNNYSGLGYVVVPGYNIALYVGGTLTANKMQVTSLNVGDIITKELTEMGKFYTENKIMLNYSRFKRFRTVSS